MHAPPGSLSFSPTHTHTHTHTHTPRLEEAWAKEHLRSKPSLTRALIKTFGWTYFVGALYKFAYDTLLFVGA
jgi:hypothetical protein